MKVSDTLNRAISKIDGAHIVSVPDERRLTRESFHRLNNEIHAQRERNADIRYRSFQKAK